MRPIPVPDDIRSQDWVLDTKVFAGPTGELDDPIPPAEGIIYRADYGEQGGIQPCIGVILMLEDEDIERIKAGARHILMSWPGVRMPVFTIPVVL